jgi:hypothetical protein
MHSLKSSQQIQLNVIKLENQDGYQHTYWYRIQKPEQQWTKKPSCSVNQSSQKLVSEGCKAQIDPVAV